MRPEQVPVPSAAIVHLEPRFDPARTPREQLSAMVERLVVVEAKGAPLELGWVPERSPGGAFRLQSAQGEAWFDAWDAAREALERAWRAGS